MKQLSSRSAKHREVMLCLLKAANFFFITEKNVLPLAETHVTNSAVLKCIYHLVETFALLELSIPVAFCRMKILLKNCINLYLCNKLFG